MESIKSPSSFFIKENYVCNPVKSFDLDDANKYWTDQRLETSNYLQYHVYELASKLFTSESTKRLLDIGCGPGVKTKLFFGNSPKIDVHLFDQPSIKDVVERIFPGAHGHFGNIEDPNFSLGGLFDYILCVDVIEHLENPDLLLDQIKRHCARDATVLISTPDRDMRRGKNNIQSPNLEHVREWSFDEFAKYITHNGFQILKHVNLPSIKLNPIQMLVHKLFYKKIRKTTWYPCQAIIAKLNLKL